MYWQIDDGRLKDFIKRLCCLLCDAGDSTPNIVIPTMSYLPLIIGFAQRYDPNIGVDIGVGKLIVLTLPYAIASKATI